MLIADSSGTPISEFNNIKECMHGVFWGFGQQATLAVYFKFITTRWLLGHTLLLCFKCVVNHRVQWGIYMLLQAIKQYTWDSTVSGSEEENRGSLKAKMRTVASLSIKDGLQIQEANEWKQTYQTQMLGLMSMTVIRMEHAVYWGQFLSHMNTHGVRIHIWWSSSINQPSEKHSGLSVEHVAST